MPSQVVELLQTGSNLLFAVELGIEFSTKIDIFNAVTQNMIDHYEHGVCHGDCGSVFATSRSDAFVRAFTISKVSWLILR